MYPINANGFSVVTSDFCDYTCFIMARPKTPTEKYRGTYVRIRVTKAERAEILRRSREAQAKNESVWIRERLLGDQ